MTAFTQCDATATGLGGAELRCTYGKDHRLKDHRDASGALFTENTAPTEDEIRADERARLASRLRADSDTIGSFAPDGTNAVRLVAWLITNLRL